MFIYYLSWSSGDLTNTSSQICGIWYLPIFLFRDGSLTLIRIASLMVLAMLWSSLPTMLKLSRDTSWPVMLKWSCMGDGSLICSLNLSANVLPESPIYSTLQSTLPHLYQVNIPLFCSMLSLSLWCNKTSLIVLPPLKYISMPCFLQMFLQLSINPFI